MIYPYHCKPCDHSFDVIKSVKEYQTEELCPKCQVKAEKQIGMFSFYGAGDWKPSFNPAFGCIVKNKAHQREILSRYKDQGKEFEEVGSEPVEKIHKYFDAKREEKREERWNESTEKVLNEALRG